MTKRNWNSTFLATAIMVLAAVPSSGFDEIRPNNFGVERTFEGTVVNSCRVVDGLMYFGLQTPTRVWEIQVGPRDFLERNGFEVKVAQTVTVSGEVAMVGNREVVLAREVRTTTGVFMIRDRNGRPRWDAERPVEMDTEFPTTPVCSLR